MEAVLRFLDVNPPVPLFLLVGMAPIMGRVTVEGYGHGMVAPAIAAGAASHAGPARAVAGAIHTPIGLPAWSAVSGILRAVFGCVAMVLS